ncbi:MAG: hypothetical protein QM578_12985 [Pantoea sp.]|uniref:Lipoprotein n=1 Tax=Pantoea phytobeneficialis TaxID=2052056 RepID=A0AAP9H9F2_9GAMM|nr:hypothetical protein [Pantoea phytobeneficialis]MDO6408724.1 hypothetical protein [Pantoea phytobeneficialis]QGR08974.1 hypothetical protein CTZ24_21160 [Pantoea phytobeneficialis]
MFSRLTLASLMAATLLTGCARHATSNTASTTTPAPISTNDIASPFEQGPTIINVTHEVTRTDDGSAIYVTVDGQDAGLLTKGEDKLIHVSAGKHKIGGYVQTLFGFGRVTIQSVDVTTDPKGPKNVVYSVSKQKPAFSEVADSKPGNS